MLPISAALSLVSSLPGSYYVLGKPFKTDFSEAESFTASQFIPGTTLKIITLQWPLKEWVGDLRGPHDCGKEWK